MTFRRLLIICPAFPGGTGSIMPFDDPYHILQHLVKALPPVGKRMLLESFWRAFGEPGNEASEHDVLINWKLDIGEVCYSFIAYIQMNKINKLNKFAS